MRRFISLVLLVAGTAWAHQWTTSVVFNVTTAGKAQRALLWVPPSASQGIRGIIVAAQTSSETPFTRDTLIRAAADAQRLAIVHFYPSGLGGLAAADTALVTRALDRLADASGFQELRTAPWITFGHSAGSLFALYLAYWKPERTIAVIVHKGGLVPRPSWARGQIHYIPVLAVQGQFEEFGGAYPTDDVGDSSFIKVVRDVLALRASAPDQHLVAPAICGGEGHMGYSDRARPLLAMFIRKAAERRLPPAAGAALRNIPASSGWLAGSDLREKKGAVVVDTFPKLDPGSSRFWLVDGEFARVWLEFHKELTKTRQRVCPSAEKPQVSPSVTLTYVTDGKLFDGRFTQARGYKITARSSSGLPVKVHIQAGPGIVEGDSFRFDPCGVGDESTVRVLLRQDGNGQYSVGDRMIKARLLTHPGTAQSLTVKKDYPQQAVGDIVDLQGTSSSGLPVHFSIVSGPAVLDGRKLVITPFTLRRDTCSVILRAGQSGNGTYAAAPVVEFSIRVRSVSAVVNRVAPTGLNIRHHRCPGRTTLSGRLVARHRPDKGLPFVPPDQAPAILLPHQQE